MTAAVAITGASGFLGHHLAQAFVAAGTPTIAVVRNPARLTDSATTPAVDVRQADLGDRDALCRAFAGVHTVVANAALGSGGPDDAAYLRTNIEGAENTVEAAHKAGARHVICISTVAVYLPQLRTTLTEDAPQRLRPPGGLDFTRLTTDPRYSYTKSVAEARVRALAEQYGLRLTILRPGPIYGSRDTRFTQRLLASLHRRLVVAPGVGVPLVHAGDVAHAARAAFAHGLHAPLPQQAYNLAGAPVSLPALHRTLRDVTGIPGRIIGIPLPLWAAFDSSAAARDLGFVNRTLRDGLHEVWQHHRTAV